MFTCRLCGSVVEHRKTHEIWHIKHGDLHRKQQGYCTECGAPIRFLDGRWTHPDGVSCNWKKGTPRDQWRFCPNCGQNGSHDNCSIARVSSAAQV